MNSSIFISYRRDDSATICGRIFDALERYFGSGAVFKDVDSIPIGVPFPQYIDSVLQKCSVTLVVIGKGWLDARGPNGARRLDDPTDPVRLEVETALRRSDMVVIPLLVEGAAMPAAASLPASLRPVAERNAALVRNDPDYQGDIVRLQTALQSILLSRGQARSQASAGSYLDTSVAAKYAPGRTNRGALITVILGAVVVVAVVCTSVLYAEGKLSSLLSNFRLPGGGGTGAQSAVQATITHFCQDLHDGKYSAAYAYFSPHYKQTITSPSDVPNVLNPPWGPSSDCAEDASGGFLRVSSDESSAHDTVNFTVSEQGLGTHQIPATVNFVKSGSSWLIDSISS